MTNIDMRLVLRHALPQCARVPFLGMVRTLQLCAFHVFRDRNLLSVVPWLVTASHQHLDVLFVHGVQTTRAFVNLTAGNCRAGNVCMDMA